MTGCCEQISLPKRKPETQQESQKSSVTSTLLRLHNFERSSRNVPLLELADDLNEYAQKHTVYMAKNNSLRHSNISVLLRDYSACAENIAAGQKTPEDAVESWMGSYGHRSNILSSDYRHVGFGYFSIEDEIYWCAVFGN